jgi:hypothetical protein
MQCRNYYSSFPFSARRDSDFGKNLFYYLEDPKVRQIMQDFEREEK